MLLRALTVYLILSFILRSAHSSVMQYSRTELLHLRSSNSASKPPTNITQFEDFTRLTNVDPSENSSKARNRRGRKRGKRGGLLVRLRRRNFRAPVPSMILANVQRLFN